MILHNAFIFCAIFFGIVFIGSGALIKTYKEIIKIRKFSSKKNLNSLCQIKIMKILVWPFVSNKMSRIYKYGEYFKETFQTSITVEAFYMLKILIFILVTIITLSIRVTNNDVAKRSIIANPSKISIFSDNTLYDYRHNFLVYNSIIKRIGEAQLRKMSEQQKFEAIKKSVSHTFANIDRRETEERASSILKSFIKVETLSIFNLTSILVCCISFFLIDFLLIIKNIFFKSLQKKEVIKLEYVFELLAGVKGLRTIEIIAEMSNASYVFRKHMEVCLSEFASDRELALDNCKKVVSNSRMKRLIDVMRVYTSVDKKTALQILERNRLEKEEDLLMSANEDMDFIDVLAFLSILPIIIEISNLLMRPMLDMINEAFKYLQ